MIAYLRGRVLATTAETVIVDVNGVGYEVYCSGSAFGKIGNGDVAELYTYLQVKEDGVTLFGFSSPKEKELFLKLISVSGVGPKMGIGVLTAMNADDFAAAVATADVKRLSTVKGLGKKDGRKDRPRAARQNFRRRNYERERRRAFRGRRSCGKRQTFARGRGRRVRADGLGVQPLRQRPRREKSARGGRENDGRGHYEGPSVGRIKRLV